jgi:hypothetical protein
MPPPMIRISTSSSMISGFPNSNCSAMTWFLYLGVIAGLCGNLGPV